MARGAKKPAPTESEAKTPGGARPTPIVSRLPARELNVHFAELRIGTRLLDEANSTRDPRLSARSASRLETTVYEAQQALETAERRRHRRLAELQAEFSTLELDAHRSLQAAFRPTPEAQRPENQSQHDQEAAEWSGPKGQAAGSDPKQIAARGTSGSGEPLPHLDRIQAGFGSHEVGDIRAHVGGAAADASSQLGARGFAFGGHVAFAQQPDLHTAAHEAAHVVQQRGGVQLKAAIDTPGDAHEQEADAVADSVVKGVSAEPLLDRIAGAGRGRSAASPVVQRDTSTGSKPTDDADKPPLPGQYSVGIAPDGMWIFSFNSTDALRWGDPIYSAMSFYMGLVFPGASPTIIREALTAQGIEFEGGFHRPKGKNLPFNVGIRKQVHDDMKVWMHAHYPGVAAKDPSVGVGDLGSATSGAAGAKGAPKAPDKTDKSKGDTEVSESEGGERGPVPPADVERARALYERIRRAFPDSDAWQSGAAPYPEFLAFLAEHAEQLKHIPKSAKGAKATSVADLKKLLDAFERHQLDKEKGDASGDIGGDTGGDVGGTKDGNKTGDSTGKDGGKEGGSQYGEVGGSKYGSVKWEPKGAIEVQPQLDTYVAGSNLNVEMKWDLSVHPRSGLVLLANHCTYVWKTKQNGKVVDSDGNSIFANDRYTNLRLGKAAGEVEIEVEAKSRHFTTKTFQESVKVKVVSEADYDKATFASKHVGKDKAFSRDDKGALHANADQKPLTVDDEITTTGYAKGGIDELREQGQISESAHEVLAEQATNQRAALLEIKEKVKAGTPYLVRGTFVSREDSQASELKLLMHMTHQTQKNGLAFYDLILHDLTSGDSTQHPGSSWGFLQDERPASVFHRLENEALDRMADHFHAHNDYSKGTVHLAAQRLTDGTVWEDTRDTNNARKKAKKALGTVAMVGGVALLVVPGGGALAVGLMTVSAGAGAASVALEIEDRYQKEGKLKVDRRLVLDVLQLASTALSFGALSTTLKEASAIAKTRYMLSLTGIDAAQGFVITWETRDTLRQIDATTEQKLAGAKSDDDRAQILAERDRQVAEVIGGAIVSGGFLLVSLGGGIKQVMATSRAGRQFAVREPVKLLGERSAAEIQDAIGNQRFIHDNRAVVLTDAESQFLEAQLLARQPATTKQGQPAPSGPAREQAHNATTPEESKAPHERTTQQMPAVDPEAKGTSDENKPPHERTTRQMPAVDPEAKGTSDENKPPHERTTQKMAAVDPAKSSAQEPTKVSFTGKGDVLGAVAKTVSPEPGYFDVVVHGDPNTFYVLHNGSWIPVKPNSVRKYISRQPGYHGQPIRLISCEAGAAGDGIAQAMANGLGTRVKAPIETVWINSNTGELIVGADPSKPNSSGWREFAPGKIPDAAAPAVSPESAPRVEPNEAAPRPDTPEAAPRTEANEATGNAAEETAVPDEFISAGKKKAPEKTTPDPEFNARGEFKDQAIEAKYREYKARKVAEAAKARKRADWKERVEWWQNHSPAARGNRFNRAVRDRNTYPYNEVNLVDGTRLDSYDPANKERISRKATDFNKVSAAEFQGYLTEIDRKYPRGKKIRSNTHRDIDGKRLVGDPVLEVPSANLKPEYDVRREQLEELAEAAGVELRYTDE